MECDAVVKEAEKIVVVLHKSSLIGRDVEEHKQIRDCGNFLQNYLPRFSAAGFFAISRATILSIFGTVMTFLIVLLEFYGENTNKFDSHGKNDSLLTVTP